MQDLPENTAQDPLLMKLITRSIEKTILNEDADANVSAISYDAETDTVTYEEPGAEF